MQAFKKTFDATYLTGLILLLASLVLFVLPDYFPGSAKSGPGGMFMINYLITVAYFIILIARGKLKRGRDGLHSITLLLVLFLVSAYALNREMGIFERSAPWFCVVLVLISANYIAFVFFHKMPVWARHILCILAGLAAVVFVYLSIYLVPIYIISTVCLIALGISLHAFVPLLFCFYTWLLIRRASIETRKYRGTFVAGMAVTILFVAGYVIRYNETLSSINRHFQYSSISDNDQLPAWVKVAQQMPKNDVAEKILKNDLVYSVPSSWNDNFFWRMPNLNFKQKVHDPLVMVSSFICGKIHVSEDKRIKILETLYDSRHQAQERLWSGDDISTEAVSSRVQIWPKLRLSYTQLEIVVTHVANDRSWLNRQEAIYTFHLPEGAVATSLSLWIDGREEKGVLTSKAKADSAYKQIVGVENRDPSVVHWQEGNTVTVRVFPVLNGESRKFKLGITCPLRAENDRLYYDNIYFDGPSSACATENVSVTTMNPLQGLSLPEGCVVNANVFTKEGTYDPSWSISFTAPPLSNDAFHFNNYTYQVLPVRKEAEPLSASSVYLDINASWPPGMCEQVYQLVKSRKVFVTQGGESFTRINDGNRVEIFGTLRHNQFSLFPFYKIPAETGSLVITHSGPLSPVINDIRNSAFLDQTQQYFKDGNRTLVFGIGSELSPYLKSLKEFRMLDYDHGTLQKLQHVLSANTFDKVMENDDEMAIEAAGISIKRINGQASGNAPDHLMRLFAYNHILQQSGRTLLNDTAVDQRLVDEAQQAYVVSPVSSLVVLETQKDYDRFDISSSKNSLMNASLKSKGAVPEPAEWALIFIVAAAALFVKFFPRLSFKSNK